MRRVWEGINLMDGSKKKGNSSLEGDRNGFQMIWTSFTLDLIVFFFFWEGDKRYANDLNEFYATFDCHDFQSEIKDRFNFLFERGTL